jgi:ubiquinone/menaquinone biosynthesis C-methylase UbiE
MEKEAGAAAEPLGDRKRQRATVSSDGDLAASGAAVTTRTSDAAGTPPPPYGSKDYWEARYEQLKQKDGDSQGKTDADPFHAWYFSFDELAPLILPLILGDEDTEEIEEDESNEGDEKDVDSRTSIQADKREAARKGDDPKPAASSQTQQKVSHNGSEHSYEEDDEENEQDDEETLPSKRVGLAHDGPISVVEIGCGDVPLGRDLVASILDMETQIEVDAANILKKVVCLDYSENVIDAMREAQKEQQEKSTKKSKRTTIPLLYEVADARELPYKDETFELLLEKGTLDAMLSDRDGNGSKNCLKIVAECARVLKRGGCMVVISHLNAHVQTGLQWLSDVIMPGLQTGAGGFEWSIEVHGNEADIPSEHEDGDDDSYPESPGPAVYIIWKCDPFLEDLNARYAKDPPTIRMKYFTY